MKHSKPTKEQLKGHKLRIRFQNNPEASGALYDKMCQVILGEVNASVIFNNASAINPINPINLIIPINQPYKPLNKPHKPTKLSIK